MSCLKILILDIRPYVHIRYIHMRYTIFNRKDQMGFQEETKKI